MWTNHRTQRVNRAQLRVLGTSVLAGSLLLGASLLSLGNIASAARAPYGIVPLGSTNEGLANGANGASTGILVISGGPCIGPVIKNQKADRLATRITLYRNTTVVARWEIYGEQKIAWVEPVGHYSVSASDFQNGAKVHIDVTTSSNATVNLNPGCL